MIPLISVIMPVFNAEKFISTSIESVLQQSFLNFELIILNDGSTDHSEQLILRYKDKRIRYFKHSINRGLISTLNEGLRYSAGDFIARLDADDIAKPDRLFRQVQFLLRNPDHSICASSYDVINTNGRKKYRVFSPSLDIEIRTLLFFCNCICHSSVMIRKNALQDNVYRQAYQLCEDYDLWSRLIDQSKVAILSEPLIHYRLHNDNISMKNRLAMLSNVSRIHAYFLNHYGFSYTRDEFLIHHAFLSYNIVYLRRIGFQELEKWIIKLVHMFYFKEYADIHIAKRFLIRRWLSVCLKGGEYRRLIANPLFKYNRWQYITIFGGKILDNLIKRNNVLDF